MRNHAAQLAIIKQLSRQELQSTAGNCQADDRQESCSSAGNCQAGFWFPIASVMFVGMCASIHMCILWGDCQEEQEGI